MDSGTHPNSSVGVRILVVCRGNVRRSPAVAELLRQQGWSDVDVESVGTEATVGDPADSLMAAEMAARGGELSEHRARLLTPLDIEAATLILTLERSHRQSVVRLVPAAVQRTFTVSEFAELVELIDPATLTATTPAERLTQLLDTLVWQRAMRPSGRGSNDDIADLRRVTARGSRRLLATVSTAVQRIAKVLNSPSSGSEGAVARIDQAPSLTRAALQRSLRAQPEHASVAP